VFQIRCTHRRRHLPVRGLRFSLPQANAQHDRPNGHTKCLPASSDGRIQKVLPCSRLRHGFNRLVRVYGVASCSVYEFCAAAPKSSRGLGGARELEMGRPAANCPACEQSQVSRTRQGRLERERSDAQACRAGTTATPSRLPGVNGLLLHKSNLMQNVLLLCCEETPSGRDGEQKVKCI
jgi:hypothetical protein